MDDQILQDDPVTRRLRWMVASRVAIVTFLLGVAVFFQFRGLDLVPEISLPAFYLVILVGYLYSIASLFVINLIKSIKINIYTQALCDVALVTALVYVTGGIRSIYGVFYPLVIIYAILFQGRNGGLIIASACSIFYGLLIDFEYYRIIPPVYFLSGLEYPLSGGAIFLRIILHIFSFYMIALLASFLVKQEEKARALLAEKESAFDQLDQFHRSIIESVDTGILTMDLAGNIKSFNRAAEEITGFSFSEVENRNIHHLFPGYGDMIDRMSTADRREHAKNRVEIYFSPKSGDPLNLGCSVSPFKDERGKRMGDILIFQDLTSIKQMEEAIEQSRRLAYIGEMAASLAHEIRNPLASISGSIQVLSKSLFLSETDARLMQIILRGKEQLENFMRDFLLLSGPLGGSREIFDVNDVIKDVLESLPYHPEWHQDIEIVKVLPSQTVMHASRKEIRQVCWNLIMNAVQAMPEGGKLEIDVRPSLVGDMENYLEIKIADTGCGIDEKGLARVFEPFYTTKERGTGLGLAVVHRIVEAYAGEIRLISKPGEGTVCFVWLPRKA